MRPAIRMGKYLGPVSSVLVQATRTFAANLKRWGREFQYFLWKHRYLHRMAEVLIIGLPPFAVMHYYSISQVHDQIKQLTPAVAGILDSSPIQWVLFAVIWSWFWHEIIKAIATWLKAQPTGWENAATFLLRGLSSVVGSKNERFRTALRNATQSEKRDPWTVFDSITQPEQQFSELMLNLYLVFQSLLREEGRPPAKLRVNLAVINDNRVVAIQYHYPRDLPVRSSMESLNNSRSAIQNAIRTRKIVVIESIKDEAEKADGKFAVTDEAHRGEDGSLLCYPIHFPPLADVAFVVSVCYDERASFKKRFTQSYKEILEPFALRLRLEYSLLGLKEIVRDDLEAKAAAHIA